MRCLSNKIELDRGSFFFQVHISGPRATFKYALNEVHKSEPKVTLAGTQVQPWRVPGLSQITW